MPRKKAASKRKKTTASSTSSLRTGPAKFVLTPQTPVRQLWISAQSTSFKLDWSAEQSAFLLAKTGESLKMLVERLLREFLDNPEIHLA